MTFFGSGVFEELAEFDRQKGDPELVIQSTIEHHVKDSVLTLIDLKWRQNALVSIYDATQRVWTLNPTNRPGPFPAVQL